MRVHDVRVVRADERRHGGGRRHRYEVLTPPLPGLRAEVSLHSLAPGASTAGQDDPPMHEAGSRETAVVERGPLRFVCGGAAHDLADGDSVTFDADLPHHFENPGDDEASFYAVVAAGLRRS
jgi:quercetin dioxygenase-like cupin family protein